MEYIIIEIRLTSKIIKMDLPCFDIKPTRRCLLCKRQLFPNNSPHLY